ncbi:hypothetical protein PGT21_029432 [Puccinia graminis f. sp. tritici]|uniref:Uncharacterized protein n=1 Tax=Puccinia graminis f. sp. tritici TaxID=56615 RepID=A0A5B0PJL3_PUCGR|nr:hypothetical protein PGT21_029432 [Puccinia graminis f. sp. tritici]
MTADSTPPLPRKQTKSQQQQQTSSSSSTCHRPYVCQIGLFKLPLKALESRPLVNDL